MGGKRYYYGYTRADGNAMFTTMFSSFSPWWLTQGGLRRRYFSSEVRLIEMPPHFIFVPSHVALCGVNRLMFALNAKERQLQGKDGQVCQLLSVIKLKCSSVLAFE